VPNGGSDCCGTCWFNRANEGGRGSASHNFRLPSYCEIRQLPIRNPFYTYCANHPYKRPDRDPIPIGPVLVNPSGGVDNDRVVWKRSPDSEAIRRHLLALVSQPPASRRDEGYNYYTPPAAYTAVRQLVEFAEPRAVSVFEEEIRRAKSRGAKPRYLQGALRELRKRIAATLKTS